MSGSAKVRSWIVELILRRCRPARTPPAFEDGSRPRWLAPSGGGRRREVADEREARGGDARVAEALIAGVGSFAPPGQAPKHVVPAYRDAAGHCRSAAGGGARQALTAAGMMSGLTNGHTSSPFRQGRAHRLAAAGGQRRQGLSRSYGSCGRPPQRAGERDWGLIMPTPARGEDLRRLTAGGECVEVLPAEEVIDGRTCRVRSSPLQGIDARRAAGDRSRQVVVYSTRTDEY